MKVLFLDATQPMAACLEAVRRAGDPVVGVHLDPDPDPAGLPGLLRGYDAVLDDHTALPTELIVRCPDLKHVIFLGTGARSYMDPEALAGCGVQVHTIKGYGDVAVAEHTIALMFAAARDVAAMDRSVRAGSWPRTDGVQLGGKRLGLLGYGGIAAEVARIARGIGMEVQAWNRTARAAEDVRFVDLDTLLATSDVLSIHLLLTDETRGFLDAARLARLKPGALLVNTARGAIVDEAAMIAALQSGALAHAALDVFTEEPLPAGHALAGLPNVTLTAHSAFRTPEAAETLMRRALDIARTIGDESQRA